MSKNIDLHIHTTASDGLDTPHQVVQKAKTIGLAAIAITDHDTVQGVSEAVTSGKKNGLEIIPGVEISCLWKAHRVHLLGYFIDIHHPGLTDLLDRMRRGREARMPKMLEKLQHFGIEVDQEEVEKEAKGESTGRPHLARVMLRYGYVSTLEEAFEKYLAYGRPAYVDRPRPTIEQGIKSILKASGVPVIAHPLVINVPLAEMLAKLTQLQIQGVEYYYPYQFVSGQPQKWYEQIQPLLNQLKHLARKHNLILTGGSDYHGNTESKASLGEVKVPIRILTNLRKRHQVLLTTYHRPDKF